MPSTDVCVCVWCVCVCMCAYVCNDAVWRGCAALRDAFKRTIFCNRGGKAKRARRCQGDSLFWLVCMFFVCLFHFYYYHWTIIVVSYFSIHTIVTFCSL